MKIDKSNPWHWMALLASSCLLLLALPYRLTKPRRPKKAIVVFYGHTLNSHLRTLYTYWLNRPDVDVYFLSFDHKKTTRQLRSAGYRVLDGLSFRDLVKLTRASVFFSSHGLHHFVLLRMLTSMKFIDLFHSPLAYKGFDASDFKHLHPSDEVWVSSRGVRKIYIHKYGFDAEKVKVTGCARVEDIWRYTKQRKAIMKTHGLDPAKKTILVAPTWKQDNRHRSIVPFGLTLAEFMQCILSIAREDNIQVIFRAHLNSGDSEQFQNAKNIHIMPYSQYPNTEEFLAMSDVLINDWSSIAMDFLVTNRPIVYLDVKPPFAKGFSAPPEYRAGAVVKDQQELVAALRQAVYQPVEYQEKYKNRIIQTKELAFGDTLDGKTLERCDHRLDLLLNK